MDIVELNTGSGQISSENRDHELVAEQNRAENWALWNTLRQGSSGGQAAVYAIKPGWQLSHPLGMGRNLITQCCLITIGQALVPNDITRTRWHSSYLESALFVPLYSCYWFKRTPKTYWMLSTRFIWYIIFLFYFIFWINIRCHMTSTTLIGPRRTGPSPAAFVLDQHKLNGLYEKLKYNVPESVWLIVVKPFSYSWASIMFPSGATDSVAPPSVKSLYVSPA